LDKLIITVAPTGSVPRKSDTPFLPTTPEEIAETAYLCEQEGASVIHVHCRDAEENPTSEYKLFEETVSKIRKRTKLIIMVSTSGVAGKSDEERGEPLKTKPEMGSLTTGSLNFTGRKPPTVYVNSWETITYLARRMKEANIKPELEAFDLGFIPQGMMLVEQGLVAEPPHFQLVMGVGGGIPATINNLVHMRNQLPPNATFTVAGVGKRQADMITMAIMMGGHVRVGLEDNIYISKGQLASNEEFVAQTRRTAESLGRTVADSKEARRLLHIP
jgi:3-keto-5-aminohexanoate cleavage enzyme